MIDVFNDIHSKCKNSKLLLIGQGPLVDEIKEKVKTLNLEDSVIFMGQRNDVNELFQAFDVFLLPSLYEGLPVVGVEAQASGVLCVFSTSMTKDVKMLEESLFISLNDNSNVWKDKILSSTNYERVNTEQIITDKKFNIKKEASRLEDKYLELYKQVI